MHQSFPEFYHKCHQNKASLAENQLWIPKIFCLLYFSCNCPVNLTWIWEILWFSTDYGGLIYVANKWFIVACLWNKMTGLAAYILCLRRSATILESDAFPFELENTAINVHLTLNTSAFVIWCGITQPKGTSHCIQLWQPSLIVFTACLNQDEIHFFCMTREITAFKTVCLPHLFYLAVSSLSLFLISFWKVELNLLLELVTLPASLQGNLGGDSWTYTKWPRGR